MYQNVCCTKRSSKTVNVVFGLSSTFKLLGLLARLFWVTNCCLITGAKGMKIVFVEMMHSGHWFVLVCCDIIHKRLIHLAFMGASPLYVYMYVALNNMLVLLYKFWKKKKKKKKATQNYLLNLVNPAESAGITDLYTP